MKWDRNFGLPPGVPLLTFNTLFGYISFFAFIPFLSVYVTDNLAWSPVMAGLLLMVRQVAQQGPTFWTGMLADKVGLKSIMCWGLAVRGVGFAMFAFVDQVSTMFLAAAISGVGGALFGPTGSGILSVLTPEDQRTRVFGIQKAIGNVGIVLSTALGAALISFDFAVLSLVCGALYLFLAVLSYYCLPDVKGELSQLSFREMGRTIFQDRRFLFYTLINIGVWYLYMQLFLTIPLQVFAITGDRTTVSLVNLVVAVVVILFQFPLLRYLTRQYSLLATLTIGTALLGIGTAVLGWGGNLTTFCTGLVLFAFGIIIIEPIQFDITSRMAEPELLATYFGFSSLAIAVGGGLSQGIGGWLFQLGPLYIWGSCVAACALAISGLLVLNKCTKLCDQEEVA